MRVCLTVNSAMYSLLVVGVCVCIAVVVFVYRTNCCRQQLSSLYIDVCGAYMNIKRVCHVSVFLEFVCIEKFA